MLIVSVLAEISRTLIASSAALDVTTILPAAKGQPLGLLQDGHKGRPYDERIDVVYDSGLLWEDVEGVVGGRPGEAHKW
jgi:hypothetical protein